MTLRDIKKAIQECDNGQLEFNQGEVRSFLYGKKWYPLRATINRAAFFAGTNNELTTDRALVELVYLGVWTRIQDINFTSKFPVDISQTEEQGETKKLATVLYKLIN